MRSRRANAGSADRKSPPTVCSNVLRKSSWRAVGANAANLKAAPGQTARARSRLPPPTSRRCSRLARSCACWKTARSCSILARPISARDPTRSSLRFARKRCRSIPRMCGLASPDTDGSPYNWGTTASRVTYTTGRSVVGAAEEVDPAGQAACEPRCWNARSRTSNCAKAAVSA